MANHFAIFIAALFCTEILAANENTFEATLGCLQFNAREGASFNHPYFPTSTFKNIHVTKDNVTVLRLGILGRNDGHIRLAPKRLPFDGTVMNDLAISGWTNTKTEIRRYTRTHYNSYHSMHVLLHQSSIGILSELQPMMFTMEIDALRNVKLIKDGDEKPFVRFQDPNLSFKYIGFSNWDVPVAFFYDCPLEVDRRDCTGIVFS